jgi:hypothetical protein
MNQGATAAATATRAISNTMTPSAAPKLRFLRVIGPTVT